MMSFFPPEMFPDRCDITPAATASRARDPSGGRPDNATTPALTGVPCSFQPLAADELVAAQAAGSKTNCRVYFPSDPGDLRPGTAIKITQRAGSAPPRIFGVSLLQLAREGIDLGVTLWRADCEGSA